MIMQFHCLRAHFYTGVHSRLFTIKWHFQTLLCLHRSTMVLHAASISFWVQVKCKVTNWKTSKVLETICWNGPLDRKAGILMWRFYNSEIHYRDIHEAHWPGPRRSCRTDPQCTLTAPGTSEWSLESTSPSGHRLYHSSCLFEIKTWRGYIWLKNTNVTKITKEQGHISFHNIVENNFGKSEVV